ncbi:hypothetical protein L2E82_32055 [Cichorium intybus]|uniref:Uncharacterized protein n=1 Tax=Cichorium intybus TaxID=13427 RepID=A0ACB9BF95_CICIN|nr:hypothetical protein L2E82_32055 [Cichorium intybus]
MGEGKQGVLVVGHHNPVTQLQAKYKELETGFKDWLAKQSLPVEAAIVTATSSLQGAAIGGLMGTFTNDLSSSLPAPPPPGASLNPRAVASLQQAQIVFEKIYRLGDICRNWIGKWVVESGVEFYGKPSLNPLPRHDFISMLSIHETVHHHGSRKGNHNLYPFRKFLITIHKPDPNPLRQFLIMDLVKGITIFIHRGILLT